MKTENKTFKKIEECRFTGGLGGLGGDSDEIPIWMLVVCPVIAHWKSVLTAVVLVVIAIVICRCL